MENKMITEEWLSENQVASKVNLIRNRDVLTIASSQKRKEKSFWLKKMSGVFSKSTFPYDNQNPDKMETGKNSIKFRFSPGLYQKINKLSNYSPHKCHMILVAGVVILLNRYSGINDIILGSPVVKQENVEKLINTLLPLRHQTSDNYTFKELLYQVRDVITEATNNQNYPIELIEDEIMENSPGNKFPFFNIAILLKDIHDKEYIQHIDTDAIFSFVRTDDYLEGELEYKLCLYNQSTVERIITHFKLLVEKTLFNPELPLKTIDILTDSERKKILYEFNDTGIECFHTKTVCELFELQVKRTPNSVAVIHENKQITYLELNKKSNRLAYLLKDKGVKPNIIVAILVNISIDTIISILGVLKAGGAYLPIDPGYPEDRIISILKDSNVQIVLTGSNQMNTISFTAAREILIMDSSEEILIVKPKDNFRIEVDTCVNDLAYVIYTSGSTGNPKGVMINNKSFTDFINWAVKEYEHKPGYHVLLSNSFASDGSIQQIFPPLVSGGTLHLIDKDLRLDITAYISYLKRNRINNIDEVPTLMNALLDSLVPNTISQLLPDLTCLSLGSEYVPIELVRKCKKYLNNKGKIINGYGPAEASVETCTYLFDGWSQKEKSLIGKPRQNLKVYILDRHNNCCPIGVSGEISVSGTGIARGYLNNPESTARVFIKNPYCDKPHEIVYKTGDRGTWLPDGNIEFFGRIDSQVNIRGYRVELDEIKSQILKHKDLQDAAVIVNDSDLCAYFVVKETQKHNRKNVQSNKTTIDGSELRKYLSRTLPDYMVPLYFVKIDEIPLTPNGKLDRESLPDPKRISGTEYTAPRNEIEEKLEEIWSGVLGLEKIGIKDNFFMLGGDSIKTIQISARMRKYGYRIEMRDIFQNPTIMDLASLVKKDEKISEQSVVTGVVKLTPIQCCFFEDNNINRHHYNQSVMFHSKERFSKEALQTIFTKLHEHHDSLRMRYIEENGEIKQINEGLDYPLSFDEYDLRDQKEPIEELEKKANEIQGSINLEKGPLMKVGLFHLVDGDRLLIVIHHLVIDGVSWRILFEDIETLHNQYKKGEKLDLPLKTDSFKLWSEKLSEYSNSEIFLREKSYWLGIDSKEIPEIKRDFEVEGNYIKDTESITFRLSKKETNELLTRINELFGTEINDILLTGLGIGIRETFGNENVLIAMEGHGREEIIKGIDISRTVGWFTSEYPVILDMSYRGDISRQIKEVKESLHQVPEKGIGYGILKYITSESNKSEFEFELDPQIGFNYLGQFDTDVNRSSFEIAKESSGNGASINRERDFEMDIAGMISDGQLGISINYNKNHFKSETIRRLIDHFKKGLRNIISYCTEDRSKELTPSDFGIKELSIEEFDSLFES